MMEQYEQINLGDYFQTGEGGTALSYNHKDGKTLAKLFMPGMGAEQAEREFKVNQVVYDMGLPTPKPIRLITDGTRYGAEYELVPNKRSFAQLAKQLHNTPADTTTCPHGDLHIGNIITDGEHTLWIDVGAVCQGVLRNF